MRETVDEGGSFMNKKRIAVLVSLTALIGLSACAKDEATPKTEKNENQTTTKTTKKEAVNWQGDYGLYNENRSSALTITDQKGKKFAFNLAVTENAKTGNLKGNATFDENKATYSDTDSKCDATLTKDKANITVSTTNGCSGDVNYEGTYALGAVPETVDKSTEAPTATTTETKEGTPTTDSNTTNVVAQESSNWNGTFKYAGTNSSYELMIFNAIGTETDGAFDFTIDATDQGKSGYVEGKALLKNGVGTFTDTQNNCQITFDVLDPEYTLVLSTNGKCTFYGDASIDFAKEYKKQ